MNEFPTKVTGEARYALFMLMLAYVLSYMDRNVMAVLIGPIREQFDISDFQYSVLHGFAFSVFYVILGLPIARMADQRNRKHIIMVGVFFWSLMTCLCGIARNVGTLFVARIGVGAGEAALSPAAYSMLADYYPAAKLARAIAVYCLGMTIGGGLAYIAGAAIYEYFDASGDVVLPLIGALNAWQMTFVCVGAPGFIVVILLGFMKEPARKSPQGETPPNASISEIRAHLSKHARAYLGIIIAPSLMAMVGYGTMAWYPEHLMRTYGMSRLEAGGQFGLIFLIAGSAGILVGGWAVQPLFKRGFKDAPLRVILFVAILWLIPGCLGPLASTPELAILAAWPIIFCLNCYLAPLVAGIQIITPGHMRAQVSALMIFCTNLLGLALGSTIVALLTDYVFRGDVHLRYSMAVLPLLLCLPAIVIMLQALKPYRNAIKEAEAI